MIIRSERLALRQLTSADAEFILTLLNEPDFHRFIGDKQVRTLDDAVGYIENGPQASYQRWGFGLYLVSLHNGQPIGICGLLQRDELAHPDLGFAYLQRFYRQGYGYEAAQAVIADHAIKPLLAITDVDNQPSQQLLLKLGFVYQYQRPASEHAKASAVFLLD